jgi:hypothetical protein
MDLLTTLVIVLIVPTLLRGEGDRLGWNERRLTQQARGVKGVSSRPGAVDLARND